jgi:hypothetical protein
VGKVWRLNGVGVFGFDGEGWLGYERLEGRNMRLVACVEGFIGEQEHAVAKMGVEITGQVLGVVDGEAMLPEYA